MSKEDQQPRLRVDLHSHTNHSWDGVMSPASLVRRAREVGLDRIAVTDHNEIDGALRARDLAPELVIVGEEVRCRCGSELIGLFLENRIPKGLPVEEVAERIREQGGIVYAPHPFAYLTQAHRRAMKVLDAADLCEVFNSRAFARIWNRRAGVEASARDLPGISSSDAHLPHELGRAWTEVVPFNTGNQLMAVVDTARLHEGPVSTPLPHLITVGIGAIRVARHRLTHRSEKRANHIVASRNQTNLLNPK